MLRRKKTKALPEELMSQIMFQIVSKCNIQALFLSRENLPPPIPIMPMEQSSTEEGQGSKEVVLSSSLIVRIVRALSN